MFSFPLTYQLKDNTSVKVSIVANNAFDFDLIMPNGSQRSFRWRKESPHSFVDSHGRVDQKLKETIKAFLNKLKKE
jgi:hypothetical protein